MRDRPKSGITAHRLACVVLSALWAATSFAQGNYAVEPVEAMPARLSVAVERALEPQGVRLLSGDGKPIVELWLRAEVPLKANAFEAGYGALAEGTLVGVLNFPQGGSDFRGQAIEAGVYTLRYESIPQDGNHLGAAPESNFLLLCPANADRDLEASFNFDSLVELSRQASGTNHPAPLLLMTVSEAGEFPGIEHNDLGHVALRMKTSAKAVTWDQANQLSLALVLVGRAE